MLSPPTLPAIARRMALALCAIFPFLLGGCDLAVLDPAGDVARQEGNLVMIATALMLLIIVPVMALTIFFAWKYRQSNSGADYRPDWHHSTRLEFLIWSAPLLIIIVLGAITWVSTHQLDPYRPLTRTAPGRPVAAGDRPLEIQVVALNWKWLFIYPEQGIATVNMLALPVDRQVRFRLTSSQVMNAFYVPHLAGMIYTMPGMETKLHAVINRPGQYRGMSANYSGAGFSDMRFSVDGMSEAAFDRWTADMRHGARKLDAAEYLRLEQPSEKVPVIRYAAVAPELFDRAVQMCVRPGQTCMAETMRRDMQTGGARASDAAAASGHEGHGMAPGTVHDANNMAMAMPGDHSAMTTTRP